MSTTDQKKMSDSVLGEGEDGLHLLSQLDELEIDISFDSPGKVTLCTIEKII